MVKSLVSVSALAVVVCLAGSARGDCPSWGQGWYGSNYYMAPNAGYAHGIAPQAQPMPMGPPVMAQQPGAYRSFSINPGAPAPAPAAPMYQAAPMYPNYNYGNYGYTSGAPSTTGSPYWGADRKVRAWDVQR